ncbi:MAG: TIGR03560 family F420-dependent LLM class oxidoreductase [Actinomycetes bacterium]
MREDLKFGVSLWPQGATWSELRDTSVRVDTLGYDSLWSYDHFLGLGDDPSVPVLDGWSCVAALGPMTSHSTLGILVTGVTHRNPALLAKMAATLDHLSDGRAVLGLGAAWHQDEHRAYGLTFPPDGQRLALLDEACTVIRSLFDQDTTTFHGEFCHVEDAVLEPKPVQGRLPILIGGGGEKKTLRIVAQHADLWNGFGTPEIVAHKMSVLRQHCVAVGRDPASIKVTVNVGVVVRDTEAQVQQRLHEIGTVAGFPDYSTSNQPYGSPHEVAQLLAEYAKIGVSQVIAVMPAPYDHETIERLATEVRPLIGPLL